MEKTKGLRTCLVCNKKHDYKSAELSRFVWSKELSSLVFDENVKQSGRGGYACNNSFCLEKIKNPKLMGKIKHFMKI